MTPTVSVHIRIFVTSAIGDVCSETQLTGIFTEFQCIAGYGTRDHRNVFIGLRDGSCVIANDALSTLFGTRCCNYRDK